MKKRALSVVFTGLLLTSAVTPIASVLASETENVNSSESTVVTEDPNALEPGTSVYQDEDGSFVVIKMESKARANVYRWGKWTYLNIAVSRGVAANAINAAFWGGGKAATSMFGIPGWAIAGLLTGASWTKKGSSPGNAVAKLWDKNNNGWIGFYKSNGYDAAGRVVATRYKTD